MGGHFGPGRSSRLIVLLICSFKTAVIPTNDGLFLTLSYLLVNFHSIVAVDTPRMCYCRCNEISVILSVLSKYLQP